MGLHTARTGPRAMRRRRRLVALAASASALALAGAYVGILPGTSGAGEAPATSARLLHGEGEGGKGAGPAAPAPPAAESGEKARQAKNPGTQTATILYGPMSVPAAVGETDGRSKNKIDRNVVMPCKDCFLTRVAPSMVYGDGTNANVDTGPGLHHFVMLNDKGTDATCGGTFPNPAMFLGERFAAAGNERTIIEMPATYGYPIAADSNITMISDLMNHAEEEKTIYIKVEYDFVPKAAAPTMTPVRPVWMDVAPCSSILDTYKVDKGPSTTASEWEVNVPGKVVAMGGHLHNDGITLTATNKSTGEVLCDSKAAYGTKKEFVNIHGEAELSEMKSCVADPVATVKRGEKIELAGKYDSSIPRDDVMGIMVTYIAEE